MTKYFVFVHVQKTGGSFVRQLCEEHLPADWFFDPSELIPTAPDHHHLGYRRVPPEFAHLPALCFVRNPWDWYVSFYHDLIANPRWNDAGLMWEAPLNSGGAGFGHMIEVLLNSGRADFGRLIELACSADLIEELRRGLPVAEAHEPGWLRIMREEGLDYFSVLFKLAVGDGPSEGRLDVGRFESLRGDLLAFVDRHEVPMPRSFIDAVRNEAPVNVSARRSYREYYSERLRNLLGERAQYLIERYRYDY
jgi:hypothetical protein